jgi:hypothetical protein
VNDTEPEQDPADALDPLDPGNQTWTTTEAAARAHVDPETILTWAKRGKLTPVGELHGQHLFNGAEVLAVEKATRRTPRLVALLAESRALFRRGDAMP